MLDKNYYVYILASKKNGTLYTGVTNNLPRRIFEHKNNIDPESFTNRYNVKMLVYYEHTNDVNSAIAREKQIKAGSRNDKISLIERFNSEWTDLYDDILK